VIRSGKGELRLQITTFSLALELGNALRVPEGHYREQENGAQQDMPPSSACRGPYFHAKQLTLERATLPESTTANKVISPTETRPIGQ
jgi:hypothetical protein